MGIGKIKSKAFAVLLSVTALSALSAAEGARRFGLFIGSNNGGGGRAALRYAVSDARQVSQVFAAMGGIGSGDNVLLVEPGPAEIRRRLESLGKEAAAAGRSGRRTELVFYYSGHSDENGLLLGRERYGYRELREQINMVQADMRIVILDSCSSGAITRAKGGMKTSPFLFDSSLSAEGYAFLTSSSADETSQESDSIAGSYFTHSLVTGLRGAADSVGDGRVTLNELYRFAYDETLAKTETSRHGAQHPSYDIQISGSGDVVLTDIKGTSAGLVIGEDVTGRLSIRDGAGFLTAELTKAGRKPVELGLEPGAYRITLRKNNALYRTELRLPDQGRVPLGTHNFVRVNDESPARTRGPEEEAPPDAALEDAPEPVEGKTVGNTSVYLVVVNVVSGDFRLPVIGLVNVARGGHSAPQFGLVNWNTGAFTSLQAGPLNTAGGNPRGVQLGLVNTVRGTLDGFQQSLVNTVSGDVSGVQLGLVNTAGGKARGLQLGLANTAFRGIRGAQAGLVNVTKELNGLQFGLLNYVDSVDSGMSIGMFSIVRQGGYRALELSFAETMPLNLAFKIGTEKFYNSLSVSYDPGVTGPRAAFGFGYGVGSIIPVAKDFFFNPELNSTITFEFKQNFLSLTPLAGFRLGSRLSIVAGPSLTYMRVREDSGNSGPLFTIGREFADGHSLLLGARAGIRVRL
ncbi:MAG: caspase family protein [Spirochaetaceae bacterium]|jgi:hypothetical protein|nr:caspase family protein [Spirochaetaceae bacterium]